MGRGTDKIRLITALDDMITGDNILKEIVGWVHCHPYELRPFDKN